MKNIILNFKSNKIATIASGLALLVLVTISCIDEDYPSPKAATIQTESVTAITGSSAISGGKIISDGGHTISTRGICWGTEENPTIGGANVEDTTGLDMFSLEITGLVGGTTYYVRAYATNNGGIAYGNNETFTTKFVPILTTAAVSEITGTSVKSGGVITDSFGAQIVERGVCWSTDLNPTIDDSKTMVGAGTDPFVSTITGLLPSTLYHVRAYATTSEGETGYGNDILFNTLITDFDGNIYNAVKIGNQIWMTKNYECLHYTDGTEITVRYHKNDPTHEYGPSYAWNDIVKPNFTPDGWHVPTDSEWAELNDFVKGDGLKLKEKGTDHWNTDNGTNETGFTAWGGSHTYGAPLKVAATWWTSSDGANSTKGMRWTVKDDGQIFSVPANVKTMSFTVRLVKD